MEKGLIIPGGGLFGYIPAYLIARFGIKPIDHFTFFAGTSVGSQLALGYAMGKSAEEVKIFFEYAGPEIFNAKKYRRSWWTLGKHGSRWNDTGLNQQLKSFLPGNFQDKKLLQAPVFVPAAYMPESQPKIFDNISTADILETWEVARASAAAPTYFEPYMGYADGGLIANDPSTVAIIGMKNRKGVQFENMKIFTVGTGVAPNQNDMNFYTAAGWLNPLLNITLEGGNEKLFSKMSSEILLPDAYCRWDRVPLDGDWGMDDASLLPEMRKRADVLYDDFARTLEKWLNS